MSTHTIHDFKEDGPILTDGCPRCVEHSVEPWRTLDNASLGRLFRTYVRQGVFSIFRSRLDELGYRALAFAILRKKVELEEIERISGINTMRRVS